MGQNAVIPNELTISLTWQTYSGGLLNNFISGTMGGLVGV